MRKSLTFVVPAILFGAAVAACGSESNAGTPSPASATPTVDQSTAPATATLSGSGSAATIAAQASPAGSTTPTQAAGQLATAPASQTAPPTDTPATPVVGGPQPGSQAPGALKVTLADDGKTISLTPGQTFLLALGDGPWSPQIDNQAIVSRVVNIAVVRGAQGVYSAHTAGTAQMNARNGSTTFHVTIVVK